MTKKPKQRCLSDYTSDLQSRIRLVHLRTIIFKAVELKVTNVHEPNLRTFRKMDLNDKRKDQNEKESRERIGNSSYSFAALGAVVMSAESRVRRTSLGRGVVVPLVLGNRRLVFEVVCAALPRLVTSFTSLADLLVLVGETLAVVVIFALANLVLLLELVAEVTV